MIFGVLLAAIGLIYLLQNLGIIANDIWKFFWPILLIMIGIKIMFSRRSGKKWARAFKNENQEDKKD